MEHLEALKEKVKIAFPTPSMSSEEVRERFDDLPIIESEADLPGVYSAFFMEALRNYSPSDSVCEYFIYSLCPKADWEQVISYHARRYSLFTSEQMDLLLSFLEMVESDPDFSMIWSQVKRGPERLRSIWAVVKSNKRF